MFTKKTSPSFHVQKVEPKIKDCPMITSITVNPLDDHNENAVKKIKANSMVQQLKKSYESLCHTITTEQSSAVTTPNISINLDIDSHNNNSKIPKPSSSLSKSLIRKLSSSSLLTNKQNSQLNFSFNPLSSFVGNSNILNQKNQRSKSNSKNLLNEAKKGLWENKKTDIYNVSFNLFQKSYNTHATNTKKSINLPSHKNQPSPTQYQNTHKTTNQQSIRVSIRFRPSQNQLSQQNNQIRLLNDQMILAQQKLFAFDRLFTLENQSQVFEQIGLPIIEKLFEGFNGIIFAYGQTGSGKTHTIFGQTQNEDNNGLIPRSIKEIFKRRKQSEYQNNDRFKLTCSLVQIYKEGLIDLFNLNNNNLKLKENKQKGVYIESLKEIEGNTQNGLMKQICNALKNRRVSATKLNEKSSRSHTILTLNLHFDDFVTKLSLIDLAGSQKVRKSGVTGETLEETKKINYSLSCLGNVINALTTRQNTDHIPFRDSKLTRILQDSLSGKFLTSIIITCSLNQESYNQTISSLKFAERVKRVKILPQNQFLASKNTKEDMYLADSIQFYQEKIHQLIHQLEKTKTQLNVYKSKESLLEQNHVEQDKTKFESQSTNLSQINEITEENFITGRSMADQTEGDLTGRLPIPSERANVAEKLIKYTQKQALPIFFGSKRQSSNLQQQINSKSQVISLNVSHTLFNFGSSVQNSITKKYKPQNNLNEKIENDYDIDFSQISDHDTSQNFTLREDKSKVPHRKIVNLDDRDSQISFTFSIYKQDDLMSGRRCSRPVSTRRTLR